MGFTEHATELNGKQVIEFELGGQLQDPDKAVPALRLEYDAEHSVLELLTEVLQDPNADRLTGLVLGMWDGETLDSPPSEFLETLIAAAPRLPHLTALFLGDVLYEEQEVSWMEQGDVSPLWTAFPKLEYFRIRGSNGLKLGNLEHANLRSLVIETGGLPASVVREVAAAKLPALEHLELYLGTSNYGWDGSVADLQPILAGDLFPKLTYLGLRNAEIADEVAAAVAQAAIVDRIQILDMSLGTLTDVGAAALLQSPAVKKLKKLDLHHHFVSDEVVGQLKALPIEVDASDQKAEETYGDEAWRFTAVSE